MSAPIVHRDIKPPKIAPEISQLEAERRSRLMRSEIEAELGRRPSRACTCGPGEIVPCLGLGCIGGAR